MKTKKQKRQEILAKFEKELEILNTNRMAEQESINNRYYVRPSARQYYVEEQIENLKRNLGILWDIGNWKTQIE